VKTDPDWRKSERRRLIAEREAVPPSQRAAWAQHIDAHLQRGFPQLAQACVAFCWPYRGEYDARNLVRQLHQAGARIALPVVVRTTEDMLLLVPTQLREAAVALGMPQSYMIRKITWRAARVGLVTGLLLAVARVSGETAPLLFTALSNQFWSVDLLKTMANLPVTINNFINNPDPNWKRLAWAGALLITLAVLSLNIIARSLSGGRNPK
jgi:ABC-type uncharacterized transport system permease subunit